MGHHHDEAPVIHANALRGAGVMVLLALLGAGWSSYHGSASVMDPSTAVLEVRPLYFVDRDDGAVVINDPDGEVEVLLSGEGQFVRGVVRALARHRQMSAGGHEAPFNLVHRADGRLSLEDPLTGETIVLNAFGADNLVVFARLLGAEDRVGFQTFIPGRTENEA